jgi:hypothetical protein
MLQRKLDDLFLIISFLIIGGEKKRLKKKEKMKNKWKHVIRLSYRSKWSGVRTQQNVIQSVSLSCL